MPVPGLLDGKRGSSPAPAAPLLPPAPPPSARSGPPQTLEHGAVGIVRSKNKSTPLDLVSRCGHWHAKVAKVLLKHADASGQDKNISAPLHLASQGGHIEVSLVLLEHGADADAKDKNKWIPLHLGSRCGHVHVSSRMRCGLKNMMKSNTTSVKSIATVLSMVSSRSISSWRSGAMVISLSGEPGRSKSVEI
jgi:ankyrin repeat protein